MDAITETPAPAAFEIGKEYWCRSACDYNCIWTFKVVSRTSKFITIEDQDGRARRVGVKQSQYDAGEYALPLGSYSMAPIITANEVWA